MNVKTTVLAVSGIRTWRKFYFEELKYYNAVFKLDASSLTTFYFAKNKFELRSEEYQLPKESSTRLIYIPQDSKDEKLIERFNSLLQDKRVSHRTVMATVSRMLVAVAQRGQPLDQMPFYDQCTRNLVRFAFECEL